MAFGVRARAWKDLVAASTADGAFPMISIGQFHATNEQMGLTPQKGSRDLIDL